MLILNNYMAINSPEGKLKYWYNSNSINAIKSRNNVKIGSQKYWYNGQAQGYFLEIPKIKPKQFAVLIGF
jgi:hypothetical protein